MRCTINGRQGWKWGQNGTCYAGPEGKDKAAKQAAAINKSRVNSGKKPYDSGERA